MKLDWKEVEANLKAMGVPYQKQEPEESLAGFMQECGYQAHPAIVDLRGLDAVDADIGVLATNLDEGTNNGVYIFCVLKDHALGLVTVIPSTVSKAPMIRKISGDVTNAVTGVVLPPLTPFDMVEVTGQVIANTVMKDIATAFHIPKEKQQVFTCMYLPKFLANVAMYYTGATDKDKKPMVNEEVVDMEPAMVRQMLVEGNLPDIFKPKGKEGGEGDAC